MTVNQKKIMLKIMKDAKIQHYLVNGLTFKEETIGT